MHSEFKSVSVFNGLPDEALEFLSTRATEKKFSPGSIIVKEGESGDSFYLIASGIVRVFRGSLGSSEVELARLGNGDFFGEMCLLETLPRSATVQADSETRIFCISLGAFLELYEKMPKQYSALLHNMAKDLAQRLRRINEAYFRQMVAQKPGAPSKAEPVKSKSATEGAAKVKSTPAKRKKA